MCVHNGTTLTYPTVEELRKFHELAKLQVSTKRRRVEEPEPKVVPHDSIKQEEDGTVTITKVELDPTSSGRERFGAGTKTWKKHPLEDPTIQKFIRYVKI